MSDKIKLPKSIKVGGIYYDVYEKEIGFVDDNTLAGIHKGCSSEIKVDTTRATQKVLETFIHEIVHATDFTCLGYDLEEEHVELLTKNFIQVFVDNNLQLNNDNAKLPKKIRIGPYEYKVVFPYIFKDMPGVTAFSVIHENLAIFLSDREGEDIYKKDYIKFNLFTAIYIVIINLYRSETGISVDFKIASSALFQVFRDNKLEEFIKKYW